MHSEGLRFSIKNIGKFFAQSFRKASKAISTGLYKGVNLLVVCMMVFPNFIASLNYAGAFDSESQPEEIEELAEIIETERMSPVVDYQAPDLSHPVHRVAEQVSDSGYQDITKSPIIFVENVGQYDDDIAFVAQTSQGIFKISKSEILLDFYKITRTEDATEPYKKENVENRLNFIGANTSPLITGLNKLDIQYSVYDSDDPSRNRMNVPVWDGILIESIYPGVDLEIRGTDGEWSWSFIVGDQSKLKNISLKIDGNQTIKIENSKMHVNTTIGEYSLPMINLFDKATHKQIFVSKEDIPSVNNKEIQMPFSQQDENSVLPNGKNQKISSQQTQLGVSSTHYDEIFGVVLTGKPDITDIVIDQQGDVYIIGGDWDNGFIAKLDSDDGSLETYIDILGSVMPLGLYVDDSSGDILVTGRENGQNNQHIVFVRKYPGGDLNNEIKYTFGIPTSWGNGIASDPSGDIYVVGSIQSFGDTFYTTSGAETCLLTPDGFVVKLDSELELGIETILYSTCLGWDGPGSWSGAEGFQLVETNKVLVSGEGANRAYISKLDEYGTFDFKHQLVDYPSYNASGLAVDSNNKIVFTGPYLIQGNDDIFIEKYDPINDATIFNTVIGTSQNNMAANYTSFGNGAIDVDEEDNIYVGFRNSYVGIVDPYDYDSVLAVLSSTGALIFSEVFLPESGIWTLDVSEEYVYLAGFMESNNDAFVMKIKPNLSEIEAASVASSCDHVGGGDGGPLSSDCPIAPGPNGSYGQGGDPINTWTGALDYSLIDLSFPTLDGVISFTRFYNSQATDRFDTVLGYGWIHNNDSYLIFPEDVGGEEGKVIYKAHTANQYEFDILTDGTFAPNPGLLATLEELEGIPTTYEMVDSQKNIRVFDEDGKMTSYETANGEIILYSYNVDDTLDRVSDSTGTRYMEFSYYSGSTQIQTVEDYTGREISFTYDASDDLVTFTDVSGETWTYTYDTNHNLTVIQDADLDVVLQTYYDASGRAYLQFDGEGNLLAYITYNVDGTSTLTDAFGKNTVHAYDARSTLSDVTNPLSAITSKTYDTNFRINSLEDPNDNVTTLDWSVDGANLTSVTDALSNTTTLDYDPQNNLTSVIDANNYETKYYYEDENFPTLVTKIEYPISFDKGATWVSTEYVYYQPGNLEGQPERKLKFITNPKGDQTYYEYDQFGQVVLVTSAFGTLEAKTTTYAYDNLGRRVETVSSAGVISRTEYDNAGRVTRSIQNCKENYPSDCMASYSQNYQNGNGVYFNLVTTYTYDNHGNMIAVEDTLGKITRTYYDDADRPVTTVQNLTGQAISVTTPPSRGSGAVDENLRTDTYYDENSNVIATVDADGIITRTYYDAANRPEVIVRNLVGQDFSVAIPPSYNSSNPDQNIRTQYEYDLNGNLIITIDVEGRITRTFYDSLNRPYSVIRNYSGTVEQARNLQSPPDRSTSTSDSNLRTDTYYDDVGNVIATVNPAGIITRTYYDALGRPKTVVQNLTGQTISADAPPARTSGASDSNIRTDTYYDENGRVKNTVDPAGYVTEYNYNELGQLEQIIINKHGTDDTPNLDNQFNITTTYTYDDAGRLLTTTDTNGKISENVYDEQGRLVQVVENKLDGEIQNYLNEFNLITTYTYDVVGRVVTTTDTMGRISENQYDALGRVIQVTQNKYAGQSQNYLNEYNLVTTYTYDDGGSQIAVTDTMGSITRMYYDDLNRTVSVVRNLTSQGIAVDTPPARGSGEDDIRTDTVYYGDGRVESVVDELGYETSFGYDDLGRQVSVTDPNLITNQFGYNISGYRTSQMDGAGIVTLFEYDDLGRLTAVVENYQGGVQASVDTNVRTVYTYDKLGNRTTIKDGNATLNQTNDVTVFTYDALNRLETETDPLNHVWTYEYDALGNQVSLLDANGETTIYEYDTLGRLTGMDYPGADIDSNFSYNAVGQRLEMNDGVGTTTWTLDSLGRPVNINDPFNNDIGYEYDSLGNRTELTYPDAKVVTYEYDLLSRLEEVIDWNLNSTIYGYDASSRLEEVNLPNGIVSTYSYDDGNRLMSIDHDLGVDTVSSFAYTYDNVGNRGSAQEYLTWEETETPTPTPTATETPTPTQPPVSNTEIATEDSRVDSNSPDTNYGTETRLYVDSNFSSYLKFDLSSYAPGEIVSAELRLWVANPSADSIGVYSVADDSWQEGTITYNNRPTVGSQLGALDSSTDESWSTVDISTAVIAEAGGILSLALESSGSDEVRYRSSEAANNKPELVIYTVAPTPTATSTPTETPTPSATPTGTPANQIFTDDFESGDFSGWDWYDDGSGSMTVSTAAAGIGTYGLSLETDSLNYSEVIDYSPDDENHYRTRFYLNTNGLVMDDWEEIYLFEFSDDSSGWISTIKLYRVTGHYIVVAEYMDDSNTWHTTAEHPIYDGWSAIEIEWQASSSPGADDGVFKLWLDDTLVETVADIDNDTHAVSAVSMGLLTTPYNGTSGTLYIDGFVSNSQDYIGLDANGPDLASVLNGDRIFADGFETGDFYAWGNYEDDSGALAVSTAATGIGTYGLALETDVLDWAELTDYSPDDESHYRARFYLDTNGLVMDEWEAFGLFAMGDDSSGWITTINLDKRNGSYVVYASVLDDNDNWAYTSAIPIGDGWSAIEIEWQASSNSGADDGYINLWLNDTLMETVDNLDNDTHLIDGVSLGILNIPYSTTSGTLYIDGFDSNSQDYIGLDPNGPSLTQPPAEDLLFADGFESGNFSAWGWADTSGGDFSVTATAAADGSYGAQGYLDGSQYIAAADTSPDGESRFRARFYFDPNGVSIGQGDSLLIYSAGDSSSNLGMVYLYQDSGGYYLVTSAKEDGGTTTGGTAVAISDAWHAIEIDWIASSTAGADDGYFKLYVDDVLVDTISGLDNDTHAVESSLIGVTSGGWGSISGTIYFDAYESRSETYIGLDPNITLGWDISTQRRMADTLPRAMQVRASAPDEAEIYSRLTGKPVYSLPKSVPQTTVSDTLYWHYEYDDLYRLTYACSDWDAQGVVCDANADEFSYTYDAVGNRLSETVNGITTNYVYDVANRLTSVGAVTYTWDNNGNLLNDGNFTYTYDYANRLSTVTDGQNTYAYVYNGLGDRVRQTVNGVTTSYVLDLNMGLTQVLSDGTDTYLYGLSRIGEEDTAWNYYLGDALGSVRQLTNSNGVVTLAQTYEPYGEVLTTYGTGDSNYDYAGEMTDSYIKLIYLRSRYYAPTTGRFLTKDIWQGNYNRPLSLNSWNYVEGNPVMYTDPSGFCPSGDEGFQCRKLAYNIEYKFGVAIFWPGRTGLDHIIPAVPIFVCPPNDELYDMPDLDKNFEYWSYNELRDIYIALEYMVSAIGYATTRNITQGGAFWRFDKSHMNVVAIVCPGGYCSSIPRFALSGVSYSAGFSNHWRDEDTRSVPADPGLYRRITFLHELGHRANTIVNTNSVIRRKWERILYDEFSPYGFPSGYSENPPDIASPQKEYFAETFAFYIWQQSGNGIPLVKYKAKSIEDIVKITYSGDGMRSEISLKSYFEDQIVPYLSP